MKVLKLLYVVRIDCMRQLLVCALIILSVTLSCVVCCPLVENDEKFGDTLWHSDDEATPNDDVYDSGT
jgi:hypothetical protein